MTELITNFNKITVVGFIAKDAQIYEKLAKFSVCSEDEYQKKKQWHSVVCFGKHKDEAKPIKSGMIVKVEGSMSYGEYINKNNEKVKTADIVAAIIEIVDVGHSKAQPKAEATPMDNYRQEHLPNGTPVEGKQDEEEDSLPF